MNKKTLIGNSTLPTLAAPIRAPLTGSKKDTVPKVTGSSTAKVPPVLGSKRDTIKPWESMTSLIYPLATGSTDTDAVSPPNALHVPPEPTTQALIQHVAGVDTSIGLLPDPIDTPCKDKDPDKIRTLPTIVEQRFDGKVTVKMPVPNNPGTDWYADGYITGKRGLLQSLQQVKISNGDIISAVPLGGSPLKMKEEPTETATTKQALTVCIGVCMYACKYVCMYVCM